MNNSKFQSKNIRNDTLLIGNSMVAVWLWPWPMCLYSNASETAATVAAQLYSYVNECVSLNKSFIFLFIEFHTIYLESISMHTNPHTHTHNPYTHIHGIHLMVFIPLLSFVVLCRISSVQCESDTYLGNDVPAFCYKIT